MSDLPQAGSRLKAERERQGSSLQKVADALHLDPWVVGALEADDYARVGPPVFVRGHLKRYAGLLGLAADDILTAYESLARAPVAHPPAPSAAPLGVAPVARLTWPPVAALAALVIIGIGALCFKAWRAHHARAAISSAAPSRVEASPGGLMQPNAAVVLSRTAPAGVAGPTSPADPRVAARPAVSDTPQGSGHARLRLSFSADCWVDIHDAAGRRVFAGHGRANSVRTLSGDAPMHVYLRYANGVQLEINNRAVAIGGQFMAGDTARFEAGADGVLRREPPSAAGPVAQARDPRPTG